MPISKLLQTGSTLPRYNHTVILDSPIGRKWTSIGGLATAGKAISDPIWLDDGFGTIQLFTLGAIFWSPAFGAVYMSERVWRKWSSSSVETNKTATGETIQSYLGYPTEDSKKHTRAADVQEWQYFERGMIYIGLEGSSVVYGDIYAHYQTLGGMNGFLGVPVSDEQKAPAGGRVSHFIHGDIYEHGSSGTHEVHGAIRDRYLEMGGPSSVLGYPTSDETPIRGKGIEIGRYNRFANGSGIYWSPATGAWDVYGAIWAKWQSIGGPNGKLGFPTSGETDTPSSGGRYNEFQQGVIVWHGSGPYTGTYEVTDLKLLLFNVATTEDFNVQVHFTATPNQTNHGRLPADDEYDAGVENFDPELIMVTIDLVRANSTMTVWMEAISENTIGKDDRMGTITANYSIDNVWGLLDTSFHLHNGSFDATIRVAPISVAVTEDPNDLFWPFINTDTFKLSWESYARTFRDVNEADKHINLNPFDLSIHPWEIFLYEAYYNSMAEKGSCFGICVESLYARENISLFLEPVKTNDFNPYHRNHPADKTATKLQPQLPGDQVTLDEINVKQGYQMGAFYLEWLLSRWMAGAMHDPERAYRESYNDFQAGNWPIISIGDSDNNNGHALVPYDWDPKPDNIAHSIPTQPLIIYVKNPNFPLASRQNKSCRIEIDRLTWKWKFLFQDKEEWTGSGNTGGKLLAVPFSQLNYRPVTPGYEILGLITAGIFILLAGNGEVEQVTDGYGRTYYQPASKGINWNSDTRIPNLMEIQRISATSTSATIDRHRPLTRTEKEPQLFYHKPGPPPKAAPTDHTRTTAAFVGVSTRITPDDIANAFANAREDLLHFQLRGDRSGKWRWTVKAPRMSTTIIADADNGALDSIYVGGAGGHFQNVTLQFPNAVRQRQVSFTVTGWRGQDRNQSKSFILEDMIMDKTDSIRAQMTDGGKELLIDNHGSAKNFTLRLATGLKGDTVAMRQNITLDAASRIRFRPSDWVTATTAAIQVDVLDKAGLKILRTFTI